MYSQYYGFSHKPFELSPDPDVIFLSETHQEALSVLRYGVLNRKGFLQLTGNVGTGKSTLLQSLIQSLDTNVHLCYIPNPNFTVQEFYYFLAAKFGLEEFDGNKAKFILSFSRFLQQCRQNSEHVLLVIDEAQILSLEVLEEIRLISNQESHDVFGVLSIFLVGQPEFNVLLEHHKLLPLKNRIGISFHIAPLTLDETTAYILFRLKKAGRRTALFTQNAYREIHQATAGIPRTINILCDNALLAGFADQKGIIDEDIIRDCARELRPTEQELQTPEEKYTESKNIKKIPKVEYISADSGKRNTFFRPGKVTMTVVTFFILFIAIIFTTEYWGSLPGATPAKAWFEKLHVHVTGVLPPPIKELLMPRKHKVDLSSAEITQLPENITNPPELLEEENIVGNSIVGDQTKLLEDYNMETSITDKKKLLLKPLKQAFMKEIQL